jgi:DNA-binding MarR family transcriptional regulator
MALRFAYLAMHRRTDALVMKTGVTADQFVVLALLSEGRALTQRELASRASSDPNTLRAMLVLLEGQGLVRRNAHPTDRRARSVSLTRKGRSVFQKAWQRTQAFRAQLADALSKDDVRSLVKQLRRLSAVIEQAELSDSEPGLPGTARKPSPAVYAG